MSGKLTGLYLTFYLIFLEIPFEFKRGNNTFLEDLPGALQQLSLVVLIDYDASKGDKLLLLLLLFLLVMGYFNKEWVKVSLKNLTNKTIKGLCFHYSEKFPFQMVLCWCRIRGCIEAYYVSTHSFDDQFYKLQVALWYVFIGGIIIYGYRVVGCRAPVAVYCEVRQKEGHAKENQNINQNVQYPLLFVQKQGLDLCQDEKVVHVLFLYLLGNVGLYYLGLSPFINI